MTLRLIDRGWRPLLAGLTVLLLGGCGVWRATPSGSPWLPVLAPASLGEAIAAVQRVSGERGGESYVMLFQLEVEADRLAMVGSTVGGNTLFSLSYQGGELTAETSPLVPPQLDPAFVLADFQLAFWPLAAVASALQGSGYQVQQEAGVRRLYLDRELLVEIDYSDHNPWRGSVMFRNLRWHYQYRIDTVQFERLPTAGSLTGAAVSAWHSAAVGGRL